jgi:hypothetical protein
MGDLIEERAAGRSALWLWGQTAAAIADTVARDLGDHWVLALRAIGTGWLAGFLSGSILARIPLWWLTWNLYVDLALVLIVWPLACGWIVALTHRTQQAAMVLAFAASVALGYSWMWYWFGCFQPLCVLIGGLLPIPRHASS